MCKNPLSGDKEKEYWTQTTIRDYLYHSEQIYKSLVAWYGMPNHHKFEGLTNSISCILHIQDINIVRDAIKTIKREAYIDIRSCSILFFPSKAYEYIYLFDNFHIQALSNLEKALDYERAHFARFKQHLIRYCNEKCCLNYDGEICKDKEPYYEL